MGHQDEQHPKIPVGYVCRWSYLVSHIFLSRTIEACTTNLVELKKELWFRRSALLIRFTRFAK